MLNSRTKKYLSHVFKILRGSSINGFVPIILVIQSGSAILSWDPNTESDLSGYKVYYGTTSKSYDNVKDVGKVTSYQIKNLKTGIRYFFAVTAYDFSGNESSFSDEVNAILEKTSDDDTTTNNSNTLMPLVYNYPNPFRVNKEVTTIRYELSQSSQVTIEIFDLRNNLIKVVLKEVLKGAGEHTEDVWDGTNSNGDFVANGVYLCRVRSEDAQRIIKIAIRR